MDVPNGEKNNGKWILRELTAIKVKLDNLLVDFRDVKEKIDKVERKAIQLETSYDRLQSLENKVEKLERITYSYYKIDEIERKIENIEKKLTEHNVKIDELFDNIRKILKDKSFWRKTFWNFVTLLLASVISSLIVLAVSGKL